ncbi:hypothetical protein [Geomonas propionica]|uniref:Uncharacterized protein n=1 Tax=Geomonas propionica TaxID=2798582 RepID=A0ABS0YQB4_9BACT|nr:hypothetical protein [Geomonas propionica]MBJ6800156.1 hypothetical protein [Geomonas propionica]
MPKQDFLVGWTADLTDGTTRRGTVAVPAEDPNKACSLVAGMIRSKLGPDCEDVSVVALGPA